MKALYAALVVLFLVRCAAFSYDNIALNKKYVCSDPNPNYEKGSWNGLTDGKKEDESQTSFATGMDAKFPKSVVIDLEAACFVDSIKVFNSKHGGTKTVEIAVSPDNVQYVSLGKKEFENYAPDEFEITGINNKNVRYVKITFPDHYDVGFKTTAGWQYYVFLREVEVYGTMGARVAGDKNESALAKNTTGDSAVDKIMSRNHPFEKIENVVYGKGGAVDLMMDVFEPKDVPGKRPAVLVIHGGGWMKFSRKDFEYIAIEYARMGFVAFNIDYRLAPDFPAPAAVEDAKCAARYIHANAEKYQVDEGKIVATGGSAGSHLALMVGLCRDKKYEGNGGNPDISSEVAAVINRFGITDVHDLTYGKNIRDWAQTWMDVKDGNKEQLAREMSPVYYAKNKNLPAVLTIHGTSDDLVPFYQAMKLHVLLTENGNDGELFIYPGGDHGLYHLKKYKCIGDEINREVKTTIVEFLLKHRILG